MYNNCIGLKTIASAISACTLLLLFTATPGFAEMIVSDRTMDDIKESEAAMLQQWRKESAAAGPRFKGGGAYTDVNGARWKYGLTQPARTEPGVKYPLFIGNTGW